MIVSITFVCVCISDQEDTLSEYECVYVYVESRMGTKCFMCICDKSISSLGFCIIHKIIIIINVMYEWLDRLL